jgi:hypothetical protein
MSNFDIMAPTTTFLHEGEVWGVLYPIGVGVGPTWAHATLVAINTSGETRVFDFISPSGEVRSYQ